MSMTPSWPAEAEERGATLFCVPHGGGAGAVYGSWRTRMQGYGIDVQGVDFPGRGTRAGHASPPSLVHLAEDVAELIMATDSPGRASNRPVYLYGHSFGGTVAVETGRILEARGALLAGVVVAACRVPGSENSASRDSGRAAPQTIRETLRGMGSTLTALMNDDDYAERTDAAVSVDQALLNAHSFATRPSLECSLLAVGSTTDTITFESLEEWRVLGGNVFATAMVEGGGHMFHLTRPAATVELIANWMTHGATRNGPGQ